MQVREIMSSPVITVTPDESAENAWRKMDSCNIDHLVIVENSHEVVGIISRRELGGDYGVDIRKNHVVSELMIANPIMGYPEMPLKDAANDFRGYVVDCMPILKDGKLVGIITLKDILESMGKGLERGSFKIDRRPEIGLPIYRRPGRPPVS